MVNSSKRKLAAILFADIVGYTSMMQEDEILALEKIKRYQNLLESAAQACNGIVLKNYGDGSLMTFSNSVDAVKAAKQIQEQARLELVVPLRIGIHVGEFVLEKGDIYGNGVNLASRIESLGITGTVLFSKNVHEKIKSQPMFIARSLGMFEFKNVDEPMEVFALANEGFPVPRREEMQGKLKPKSNSKLNALKLGLIALMILALGAVAWYFSNQTEKNSQHLSEIEAITIFPFDVKGSVDIEYLGEGIVDLLSTKLDGVPNINPIDPNRVFNEIDQGQNLNRDIEEAQVISEGLGANKFILGSIIELNEELQITASQYNLQGQLINKKSITGEKRGLVQVIDKLTKALLLDEDSNAAEYKNMAVMTTENMPALKSFLQGEQTFRKGDYNKAFDHFKKATQLDTTYAMAHLRLRDAGSWSPTLYSGGSLEKALKYKHKLPNKWQEFIEASYSYISGAPQTEAMYNDLIQKYGENRAFTNGMAEYLFHHNPVHGRSFIEAKPWLLRTKELDPDNFEVNIHLADIALAENDTLLIAQLLADIDEHEPNWGKYKHISMFLNQDTSHIELEKLTSLENLKEWNINIFTSAPEDATAYLDFLSIMSKQFRSEKNHELWKLKFASLYGKEQATYEGSLETITARKDMFWIGGHIDNHYYLPASMMSGSGYRPWSDHYAELLEHIKEDDTPRAYFAAVKYAMALGLKSEEIKYRKKLKTMEGDARRMEVTKYFDFSLQAFDARQRGDDNICLAMIDSAFQYSPGYWPSQTCCMDKLFMQADIYEDRGELDKSIAFLENIPMVNAFAMSNGFCNYRLSGLYEKAGYIKKALGKCNLLIKDYKDCDEQYKPWVEEVTERRQRLMNQLN